MKDLRIICVINISQKKNYLMCWVRLYRKRKCLKTVWSQWMDLPDLHRCRTGWSGNFWKCAIRLCWQLRSIGGKIRLSISIRISSLRWVSRWLLHWRKWRRKWEWRLMSRSGYARIRRIGSKRIRRWRFWKRNYFVIPEENTVERRCGQFLFMKFIHHRKRHSMWQRRSGVWWEKKGTDIGKSQWLLRIWVLMQMLWKKHVIDMKSRSLWIIRKVFY